MKIAESAFPRFSDVVSFSTGSRTCTCSSKHKTISETTRKSAHVRVQEGFMNRELYPYQLWATPTVAEVNCRPLITHYKITDVVDPLKQLSASSLARELCRQTWKESWETFSSCPREVLKCLMVHKFVHFLPGVWATVDPLPLPGLPFFFSRIILDSPEIRKHYQVQSSDRFFCEIFDSTSSCTNFLRMSLSFLSCKTSSIRLIARDVLSTRNLELISTFFTQMIATKKESLNWEFFKIWVDEINQIVVDPIFEPLLPVIRNWYVRILCEAFVSHVTRGGETSHLNMLALLSSLYHRCQDISVEEEELIINAVCSCMGACQCKMSIGQHFQSIALNVVPLSLVKNVKDLLLFAKGAVQRFVNWKDAEVMETNTKRLETAIVTFWSNPSVNPIKEMYSNWKEISHFLESECGLATAHRISNSMVMAAYNKFTPHQYILMLLDLGITDNMNITVPNAIHHLYSCLNHLWERAVRTTPPPSTTATTNTVIVTSTILTSTATTTPLMFMLPPSPITTQ
eukprot:TRINITY_DN17241_c0_g1_i1.p1 TRINITY_DN17241_c0_g1~~TRINITY_DN17241_c0_g1_i1.p1  ORF type:complete len:514 (+),score=85.64 TRINITY_DN17241_c0_g1_i1:105-1646(+)